MNKLFTEFENESILRTYPFASGCTTSDTLGNRIGTGILIDAALYPVNSSGTLYLSSIETDGTVNISDSTGVIMQARYTPGDSSLEFYDLTGLSRHVGTILPASVEALSVLASVDQQRTFKKMETAFCSSCVFPIVNDGVTSINVSGTGARDGDVTFTNTNIENVRVSTNGSTLRFDVIPNLVPTIQTSIQHIFCIVDGKTPFRVQKIPYGYDMSLPNIGNTVAVYLDNIERNDICSEVAHREDTLEESDKCETCKTDDCHQDPVPVDEIPEFYQVEVVDIPNGAENAFYLAVPNFVGYDNPLSITLKDGGVSPNLDVQLKGYNDTSEANIGQMTDELKTKGVVLQVPGLES